MSPGFERRKWAATLTVVAAIAVGGMRSDLVAGSGRDDSIEVARRTPPVVVELFTSQGCSSCPPADRYLTELAAREDLEIIPLSFHVDYWNYIGWTDPFSSKAWSDRQRRYARAFGTNRVYTPQMVVNGRWEGVGSDRGEIERLLESASAKATAIEMSLSARLLSANRLQITVNTHRFDPLIRRDRMKVWVAVVESDLLTPVVRGENASKKLRNDRVVRHLEEVSDLVSAGSGASGSLEIVLGADWRLDELRVVTFLQDTESLQIHTAAACGLTG